MNTTVTLNTMSEKYGMPWLNSYELPAKVSTMGVHTRIDLEINNRWLYNHKIKLDERTTIDIDEKSFRCVEVYPMGMPHHIVIFATEIENQKNEENSQDIQPPA